jgi:sulfur-carrier protein adenylyltransferase/sulfurtransferase
VNFTKEQFYNRQTTLHDFGEIGQEKLQKAKIVIVGCGGLGSISAVYLAASGIGKIHLIDFDIVNVSNLHRQVFYKTEDIGKSKVKVLANHIQSITPFVEVSTSDKPITKSNIFSQINDYDVVVDCTDSLPTKYLLNDYCVVTDHILVYGSLYKNDGYIASFNCPEGLGYSANLRDAFPKMPVEAVPNCSQIGTLNPIVGIIGLMQSNEVLKIISGVGKPLINQLLIYNSSDNSQFIMKLKVDNANDNSSKQNIVKIFKKEDYSDVNCEIQEEKLLISSHELKQKIGKENTVIVSVIEDLNAQLPFEVSKKIPLSQFNIDSFSIEMNKEYVIVCNKGITSYTATKLLINKYPDIQVLSLKNGIDNY